MLRRTYTTEHQSYIKFQSKWSCWVLVGEVSGRVHSLDATCWRELPRKVPFTFLPFTFTWREPPRKVPITYYQLLPTTSEGPYYRQRHGGYGLPNLIYRFNIFDNSAGIEYNIKLIKTPSTTLDVFSTVRCSTPHPTQWSIHPTKINTMLHPSEMAFLHIMETAIAWSSPSSALHNHVADF